MEALPPARARPRHDGRRTVTRGVVADPQVDPGLRREGDPLTAHHPVPNRNRDQARSPHEQERQERHAARPVAQPEQSEGRRHDQGRGACEGRESPEQPGQGAAPRGPVPQRPQRRPEGPGQQRQEERGDEQLGIEVHGKPRRGHHQSRAESLQLPQRPPAQRERPQYGQRAQPGLRQPPDLEVRTQQPFTDREEERVQRQAEVRLLHEGAARDHGVGPLHVVQRVHRRVRGRRQVREA